MDPKSEIPGPAIEAPRSYGKRMEGQFTPQPLPRPIGMPLPPQAGENTGLDTRSKEQRKEDFSNYEKHVERRKELYVYRTTQLLGKREYTCANRLSCRTAKLSRPYFRDWGNLQYHEGKSFLAPPRLFKAELSLYFPNLYGQTIMKDDKSSKDTTPLLEGKATVISIFSSQWAEQQADSFISESGNPAVHQVVKESGDLAQIVRVNYEDNAGKAWLIRFFMSSLRRRFPEKDWNKYFVVRRGITDHIRESIGLLNSKVGYTYLVDQYCRVRWAGSGPSTEDERDGLAKGLARLVEGIQKEAKLPASAREQPRPAKQRKPGQPLRG